MFYTLRTWNLRDNIVIERSVPEFGNTDIVHNVEFSLHPVRTKNLLNLEEIKLPVTAAKIKRHLPILKLGTSQVDIHPDVRFVET